MEKKLGSFTEEEKIRYTDWYCNVCSNGHNYKLAGKHNHLRSKKHQRNVNITNDFLK